MASSINALFLGAPDIVSMGIARGWLLAGHRIAAIWYPQRLIGTTAFKRDRILASTAPGVSMHGISVRSNIPSRATPLLSKWPELLAEVERLNPDVVISAMFLDKIPEALLGAYPNRFVNLHPSILPAYRGAAPIFNMLMDRTINEHSGMTLHLVSAQFDKGDMIGRTKVAFPPDNNLSAYYMYLVKAGAALLTDQLPEFLAGRLTAQPQSYDLAPQGVQSPRDARLTLRHSAEHAAWLCTVIPQMTPLRIEGLGDNIHVKRFLNKNGAPSGAPPVVDGNIVSLDVKDARISVEV